MKDKLIYAFKNKQNEIKSFLGSMWICTDEGNIFLNKEITLGEQRIPSKWLLIPDRIKQVKIVNYFFKFGQNKVYISENEYEDILISHKENQTEKQLIEIEKLCK